MTLYPDLSDVKDQTTSSQSSRLLPVYFRLLFELVNFHNLQKMNKRDILKQFNIYYEGTEIQISVTKWAETVKIYKIVFIDKNTKKLSSKPRTVTTFFTLTGHMIRVKASDYCYPPQELPCNRIAWNENKDTVEMNLLAFKSGLWVGLFDFDERSRKKMYKKPVGVIHLLN